VVSPGSPWQEYSSGPYFQHTVLRVYRGYSLSVLMSSTIVLSFFSILSIWRLFDEALRIFRPVSSSFKRMQTETV
jgi:hypothetical protein